jgi:hypothetical protein
MSERLLVTSAGAAEGVSFAREKIRQLRAIGADFTSKQYRYRGLTVIAKIMDDEERRGILKGQKRCSSSSLRWLREATSSQSRT